MTNPEREELVKLADELIAQNYGNVCDIDTMGEHFALLAKAASALRRLASSDGGVKVKPLVWRDHRPDSFPEPAWSAQTSFGFYNIEEVSASDSPTYVVRLHAHHFVADKDSLDDAKAVAQADYEARIRSALITAPPADAGMREALAYAERQAVVLWSKHFKDSAPNWKPLTGDLIGLLTQIDNMTAALTAPGATTKSDGGQPIHAVKMPEYHYQELDMSGDHHGVTSNYSEYTPVTVRGSTSDPLSTRSDVTVERVARIIDPDTFNEMMAEKAWCEKHNKPFERWAAGYIARWNVALAKARAILATGLVPDEATLKTKLTEAEWLIRELCGHEGAEGFSEYLNKRLEAYEFTTQP